MVLTDVKRLEILLGEKAEVYKKKFKVDENWTVDEVPKFKFRFNWAGFFFHEYWMAYRGMLKGGIALAVFVSVASMILNIIFADKVKFDVGVLFSALMTVWLGFFADYLLERKLVSIIKKVKDEKLSYEEEVNRLQEMYVRWEKNKWKAVFAIFIFELVFGFALGILMSFTPYAQYL